MEAHRHRSFIRGIHGAVILHPVLLAVTIHQCTTTKHYLMVLTLSTSKCFHIWARTATPGPRIVISYLTMQLYLLRHPPLRFIPSLWTSSTAIPSSTAHPSPSNQQSKYVSLLLCGGKLLTSCSKKLPAAIGGALGGVAAVMAVILAVLCFRKSGYRHQRTHSEVDPEPIQSTFRPAAFVTYPSLNRDTPHDWSPSSLLPENTNLEGTDISPYAMSLKATTSLVPTNLLPEDIDLAPDNPSPSPIPSKPGLPFADPTSSAAPSQHSSSLPPQPVEVEANVRARVTPNAVIPAANSSKMSTCLTEEQTDLVQGLIKQNVPLTTVASVMEGWLKSERPSGDGEGSGGHSGVGSENPPDYDFPVTSR